MKSFKDTNIKGMTRWFNEAGRLHREDGPAVECNDIKEWFINGDLHRIDGPAVEYTDGDKLWFYKNEHIPASSQEEFEQLLRLKAFW